MQDSIRVGQIARGYYEDLPKDSGTGNTIQRQISLE